MTRKQIAIGISLAVHAILLVVLLVWYVPRPQAASGPRAASAGDAGDGTSETASDASPPGESTPSQPADQPSPAVPAELDNVAQAPAEVSPQEIERSIDSQIQATESLSDERKLTELEKNLKRLESVASEQSVQQVSATIAQSLGLDVDQYADKTPPAEGTFDTKTAQLSDVIRTQDESGDWRYETVMVDAQGREMRVPTDAAGGEPLYDTFELMNRYPMARGVYQSVVMPMLQKMLEEESSPSPDESAVTMPADGASDG
ncbi:hypothetical protein Enr13x_76610 [Stieleria neptunia]|uniref:Uncharacterized protein n=1 Tax=Stieleria neptunia TaxID=2527979 RepID=A0A518I3R8_9BACT|nr:hypothetical protein [Stieleria neptunia]QDV47749.1 hypothetical protein Enr13x_76610 [Stieleria neptunia]